MKRLVYLAGVPWDGFEGTDRRLTTALTEQVRVSWVDPPDSFLRGWKTVVGDGAGAPERVRVATLPAMTRPGLRALADRQVGAAVRKTLRAKGAEPVNAVVLANPLLTFPRSVSGRRVLYVTDDWVAGAPLMGLSAAHVARLERRNARAADVALAVSPWLADVVAARTAVPVGVLPNGCTLPESPVDATWGPGDRPVVGLVGQLNERLDLSLLEAVADLDVDLLVVGPRRERDPLVRLRLDALLGRPNVTWVGERPVEALPTYLARMRVGLTPYLGSDFNRSSFPLKTLDYLAAGVACVATPSPAVTWLDTDLVVTAEGPQEYARAVWSIAAGEDTTDDRNRRRALAASHTWAARARQLLDATVPAAAGAHRDDNDHKTGSGVMATPAAALPGGQP